MMQPYAWEHLLHAENTTWIFAFLDFERSKKI